MNVNKYSKIVYRIAGIMLIVFLFSSFLMSGLLARYISTGTATDAATVASWDIETLNKDGTEVNLNMGLEYLDEDSSGNWFFQINNKSEVAAVIDNLTSIALKVTSNSFQSTDVMTSWDFLSGDNPIKFGVYIYNCSTDDINDYLVYTKGASTLSKTEYDALTEDEKVGYKEDVVLTSGSGITEYTILDTDQPLTFNKTEQLGKVYFTAQGKMPATPINLAVGTGVCTVRVEWNVGLNTGTGSAQEKSFKAFYVIERNLYNTTDYTGLVRNTNGTISFENGVTPTTANQDYFEVSVDVEGAKVNKQYVIAYKQCDYFEYLIYVSSLGGEPTFTEFDFEFIEEETRSSGIYKVYYKKLTTEQINIIKSRTITDVDKTDSNNTSTITYNTIKKYYEKLQLDEYVSYLEAQDEFENSVGYLGIGLNCNLILNIKVSQVD